MTGGITIRDKFNTPISQYLYSDTTITIPLITEVFTISSDTVVAQSQVKDDAASTFTTKIMNPNGPIIVDSFRVPLPSLLPNVVKSVTYKAEGDLPYDIVSYHLDEGGLVIDEELIIKTATGSNEVVVYFGLPEACSTDNDCSVDRKCTEGSCVSVPCACGYVANHQCVAYECCESFQCGSGSSCINNRCVTTVAQPVSTEQATLLAEINQLASD